MDTANTKKLTPTAAQLVERVRAIMHETSGKDNMVHPSLIDKLNQMTPADMDALQPPAISKGFWTDDLEFCKRMAGFLFDASPETIAEMPGKLYPVMLAITSQNYINFLAQAMSA